MRFYFLIGVFIMLLSSNTQAEKSYEIVFTRFKSEVTLAEQQEAMAKLNDIVKSFSGFIARDYFYSEHDQQWVDIVQWTDLAAAQKASKSVMQNKQATSIFALMDETAMLFSHYQHIEHVD